MGGAADFEATFERLKAMFRPYAPLGVTLKDEPGRYYIGTHEVRAKDGYRTGFGGTEIHKTYVSAHLIPVYVHPELAPPPGSPLRRRMQGKSCFNFTSPDDPSLGAFETLLAESAARFLADGRLREEIIPHKAIS